MSIYKNLLQKISLPANWFLLFLVAITTLNSFFWYQSTFLTTKLSRPQDLEIRILEQQKSKFGSQYLATSSVGKIILESKNIYKVGYLYTISSSLEFFEMKDDSPKFSSYYIGNGIVAKSKSEKIVFESTICDQECSFWKFLAQTKYRLGDSFDQIICKKLNFINEWFGNSCDKVLAWSFGLIIGNGTLFDTKTKSDLKKIGITHLVVVSGFQVGLVVSFIEFLFIQLKLNRKLRLSLSVLGIFGLICIVGVQPPVLRSGLSIFLIQFGLIFFGRKLSPIRSLFYSGIILLWLFPYYVISVSFWLSFTATFGLIMSSNIENDKEKESEGNIELEWFLELKSLVLACIFTFLYTLPIVVSLSGFVSPLAILVNMILIPIIPFISLLNMLTYIPFIGEFFGIFVVIVQNLLVLLVADFGSKIPIVEIEKFGPWEMMTFWILLTIFVLYCKYIIRSNNIKPKILD